MGTGLWRANKRKEKKKGKGREEEGKEKKVREWEEKRKGIKVNERERERKGCKVKENCYRQSAGTDFTMTDKIPANIEILPITKTLHNPMFLCF